MTKHKSTKRALLLSALSLLLCMSMLVGSTFAWFTDSVTSAGNKIVAGNLDVDLYLWTADGQSVEITNESAPIFGAADSVIAQNVNNNTLWEPGKTQVAYLSIKNNGTLDLKYKVAIDVENVAENLYEVMEYAITPDAKFGDVKGWTEGIAVTTGINATEANDVALKKGEEHFFALSIHMQEEAGNQYMNGQVNFDIKVLAGQLASELDSFDATYDQLAAYPGTGSVAINPGVSGVEIPILNEAEEKVGTVTIPGEALAEGATSATATIKESSYDANITIDDGMETLAYDVQVEGLKADNDVPVKVKLRIPAMLNPETVKLYHYDEEIEATYNPYTGLVSFETTGFSPFTVVFDAESEYVAPTIPEGREHPEAVVKDVTADVDVEAIKWGAYGEWSPNPNLDAKLECVYEFSCSEDAAKAAAGPFANWECDFFLKLDRDLGENQIFLGGNYGEWGWIGFHNGNVTLKANEELPLLGSVSNSAWTYAEVVEFVQVFTCGVGRVGDALNGATFTATLRVTNPETGVSYDVAEIPYTFN